MDAGGAQFNRKFKIISHIRGRDRLVKLISDNIICRAFKRKTLDHPRCPPPEIVFVIPSIQISGFLKPGELMKAALLSRKLCFLSDSTFCNYVKAWKKFLELIEEGGSWGELELRVVPWKFGPIPVIALGKCEGTLVCMTPVHLKPKPRSSKP